MSQNRSILGQLLSVVGGAALAIDLFQPWYSLRIPQEALDQVNRFASQFDSAGAGPLGNFIRAGTAALVHLHLKVSAWDVLDKLHVVLIVAAAGAIGLSYLSYSDRLRGGGRLIVSLGSFAAGTIMFRIIVPPGPAFSGSHMLHPLLGAWLGLVAALVIVVGGLIDARSEAAASRSSSVRDSGLSGWGTPAGAPAMAGLPGARPAWTAGMPGAQHAPGAAPTAAPGWTPPEFFN
jgi:hypothetical protein